MSCHIVKNKKTGDEYLIPGCMSVANSWHLQDMTDRKIIKEFCTCTRAKREKYETHTHNELLEKINILELKFERLKQIQTRYENELDCIKGEIFMLNTEVVY